MTYETVAGTTQSIALVFFMVVFFLAVLYALWPGNRATFERAARLPLENDPEATGRPVSGEKFGGGNV
ncbi:MAG: CcoQ/FixQ family Cbb3-type cytochrome c oxidase assembly chaperone [Rhizobiales bacterium]|nr:CcoQ/FixQ family Cbb3-type cytochrome c oxidase assembly chaperone [Hyphomicrobiales bacterium]